MNHSTSRFDLAPGYSLKNAHECALFSLMAYDEPPTLECKETNTQLLVRDVGHAIVIAFRGTQEPRDFITDARFIRARLENGIQIHRGFWAAYRAIMDQLHVLLWNMEEKPLLITGHSLGGALAMIAAWDLAQRVFSEQLHSVYVFGAPRVGNGKFKRHYNGLQIGPKKDIAPGRDLLGHKTFSFVNGEDIVPRMPGWLMGYRRPGMDFFFSAFDKLELNPSLWLLALSDLCGVVNAWVVRRELTFLSHHGKERYLDQIKQLRGKFNK